jgi:glucosyl-3-phosphoglycerate synthase
VKGTHGRPFRDGGRVSELMARPLLNLHVPELAGFAQPASGALAARRSLLERLSLPVGDGVVIALLIDALREAGLAALAEADLGPRATVRRPLDDLGPVSYAVLVAAERRLGGDVVPGAFVQASGERPVAVEERPPLRSGAEEEAHQLA